jgi:D-glycero-alpha-D-manno-heptose-7-phosphate kinase
MARTVTATAPVRVCDLGGWTDTWFARRGLVVSISVRPGATARVTHHPPGSRPDRVTIATPDLPDGPDELLWAVVDAVGRVVDADLEIEVTSGVPPGAGMGTSASVTVALLAALDEHADVNDLPARAHDIEVTRLGREGGVQDQLAAACGGLNRIEIDPYPSVRVEPIALPTGLADRLRTVYLGTPHDSSAVHREVIEALGPSSEPLERLRHAAAAGYAALRAADLPAFGRAMQANTDAQADLAPGIVGRHACAVIDVARAHGALGWKVNGAGGPGGTVTVLLARPEDGSRFDRDVTAGGYAPLAVEVSPDGVLRQNS